MKHSTNRILQLAAVLAIAIAAFACTTTQTASRQVDDNGIHTAVKARLTAARFSNIVNISINVTNGIVTLSGEVPNGEVREQAGDEARAVKGVVRVNNELQVKFPAAN